MIALKVKNLIAKLLALFLQQTYFSKLIYNLWKQGFSPMNKIYIS